MKIEGKEHLAEIVRTQDPASHQELFRYSVQRSGSSHIIYWGHEHTEEAAIQMANLYLNLLDERVISLKRQRAASDRPQFGNEALPLRA